jgi:hypothetical protein
LRERSCLRGRDSYHFVSRGGSAKNRYRATSDTRDLRDSREQFVVRFALLGCRGDADHQTSRFDAKQTAML